MNEADPTLLTAAQLASAPPDERAGLVEAFLLASIGALTPPVPGPVTAASRLADLGIDSLQLVELKFGLDQVLGRELDIELIIGNPTVGGLARDGVRAAGL